jgi:hypothetical protein
MDYSTDQGTPAATTYEDTPPRNDIIFGLVLGSAVVLTLLHFVFTSYFVDVSEAEIQAKVLTRGTDQLQMVRAEEAKRLHQGKVPVEQALVALRQEGRMRIPVIAPKASDETDALVGWSFHPAHAERKAAVEAKAAGALAEPEGDADADAEVVTGEAAEAADEGTAGE